MQNDSKLPREQRRNYKHAIDGLVRICREEGPKKLFNGIQKRKFSISFQKHDESCFLGASMAVIRGAFVTVGQIAFYEQAKQVLLASGYFKDNVVTHFTSSFLAGAGATLLTMPLDVMKTRLMNAPPGTYNSLFDCLKDIMKVGPSGLFKGFMPAFIRLGKSNFIFFENQISFFSFLRTSYDLNVYLSRTIEEKFWIYSS